MTDSDLLARAARALREAHGGERQGSGFTRARIMNTLHRERRRRVLRWAVCSPILSVLLVGSAWAQSSGKWPVIWQAVASVFVAAPAREATPEASPRPRQDRSSEVPGESGAPSPDAPAPEAPADAEPTLRRVPPPEVPPPVDALPDVTPQTPSRAEATSILPAHPRSKRRAAPRARSSAPAAVAGKSGSEREAPVEPGRDPELARFRAAHDLHFAGDQPGQAAQAYADYLREFPNGRFVPEARYNGALDQIKLGHVAAARAALEPFAAGKFGGYRQKEARELLDALDRKPDSAR